MRKGGIKSYVTEYSFDLTPHCKVYTIRAFTDCLKTRRLSCGNTALGALDYINEFYDILHSASESYIVDDIDVYIKARQEA